MLTCCNFSTPYWSTSILPLPSLDSIISSLLSNLSEPLSSFLFCKNLLFLPFFFFAACLLADISSSKSHSSYSIYVFPTFLLPVFSLYLPIKGTLLHVSFWLLIVDLIVLTLRKSITLSNHPISPCFRFSIRSPSIPMVCVSFLLSLAPGHLIS